MDGKTTIIVAVGTAALCVMFDSFKIDLFNLDDASFYQMVKYGLLMPNFFLILGSLTKFAGPKIPWMVLGIIGMAASFLSWVVVPFVVYMYQDEQLIKEAPTILWTQLAFTIILSITTSKLEMPPVG